MQMRRTPRHVLGAAALALLVLQPACVDSFSGSNITVTFAEGVHSPAEPGGNTEFGRPPAGTYYTFWAVDYAYDGDGNVVSSSAFRVLDFEIHPLVKEDQPCFIEVETDRFPGLHATMEVDKLREVTGIVVETDPNDPRNAATATDVDYIDVITAVERHSRLPLFESVKAVSFKSNALPPGEHPDYPVGTACADEGGFDPLAVPPARCIDDESNRVRLAVCNDHWSRYPEFYQGNDKVFTLPLNGTWRGAVTGTNPKNGGFIGGANFFVDTNLEDFDALLVNWQYKDYDCPGSRAEGVADPGCDGEPDYPTGTPDGDKSELGTHYMSGIPEENVTRGVTHVSMQNRSFSLITAEVSIFANLDEDNVQF